ncbi:MAG: hypothetical protein GXP23_00565 [Gammaproteobacteria bacterium]|nr:hypothetical protein [Gammaproteobacteria bacterium]
MIETPRLSIVLAVQFAQENLPLIMQRMNPVAHPDVEYLICYTDDDPDTPTLLPTTDNTKILKSEQNSLIPHLWRDGILAAKGQGVVTTTAHCLPDSTWVDTLLELKLDHAVGVGGTIDNSADASARDWAIFFLRYLSYAPPQHPRVVPEIAADNALYRRTDLLRHRHLLQTGFWEPSFHARFLAEGLSLYMEPKLQVTMHNRYRAFEFFQQRVCHGRAFALARVSGSNVFKRIAFVVLSPLLPFIFFSKILGRVSTYPTYRRHLLRAGPYLVLFLAGWGLGEARGYLASLWKQNDEPPRTDTF